MCVGMRRFCLLCVGMRRSCLLCVGSCFGWVGGAVLVGAKRGFRATNDVDISVGLALLSQTDKCGGVFCFRYTATRQATAIVLARGVLLFLQWVGMPLLGDSFVFCAFMDGACL